MNYKKFKKLCEQNPDCYCPEEQILKQYLANTPEYIRRFFIGLGKEKMKEKLKKQYNTLEEDLTNAFKRRNIKVEEIQVLEGGTEYFIKVIR